MSNIIAVNAVLVLDQGGSVEDRPKFVFSFLFYVFLLALILGILFQERLPDEILGISSAQLFVLLLIGAVTVRLGWRVVMWFRSRDK